MPEQSIDDMIDAGLTSIGGAAPQSAAPTAAVPQPPQSSPDIEAAINSGLDPLTMYLPKPQPKVIGVGKWGAGEESLNAFLLGGLAPLVSGSRALARQDRAAPGQKYEEERAKLEEERKAYVKENPGQSLLMDIVPAVPSTMGAMALGQEYAAAPLARAIAGAAPRLAPALEFLGGEAGAGTGIGNFLTRIGSQATRGGAEGAAAGLLQSGLGEESTGQQTGTGAVVGAALNPLTRGAAGLLTSNISSTTAESAQRLAAAAPGAALRPGQLQGASPVYKALDRVFSGSKNAPQREAFNEALTAQGGLPSKEINQNWIDRADKINGAEMQRITQAYTLDAADPQLITALHHLDSDAYGSLTSDGYKKFKELTSKIDKDMMSGQVPGSIYQSWNGYKGLIASYSKDPALRPFVTGKDGLKEVLDEAWGRSIAAQGAPEDKTAWDAARRQYKNTRIIEEDTDPASGEYNPQKLMKRVETRYGNVNRAGDMGDLARGGQSIYPPEKPAAKEVSHGSVGSKIGYGVTGAALYAAHELGLPAHMLHSIVNNPISSVAGALGLGGAAGGAKIANEIIASPWYARHLLDVASGAREPLMRGLNPAIPLGVGVENERGPGR